MSLGKFKKNQKVIEFNYIDLLHFLKAKYSNLNIYIIFEYKVPNMIYKFYTKSQAYTQEKKLDYIKSYQSISDY